MIKVFGMQRGGTNLLCNMIYSYPEVERPRYSELQAYIYGISGPLHRLRRFSQTLLRRDYLHLDNYDRDDRGAEKIRNTLEKLRAKNYLLKVMNGNIAYYDAINREGDKNIILLRDKMSVFGSMVRRGAKPVRAANNINNFYKFAEYFSERDQLLVIRFEDLLADYAGVLDKVSSYLNYAKIDRVFLGLKATLTSDRVGKERISVDVDQVPKYLDNNINDKQRDQLVSLLGLEAVRLYEKLLTC